MLDPAFRSFGSHGSNGSSRGLDDVPQAEPMAHINARLTVELTAGERLKTTQRGSATHNQIRLVFYLGAPSAGFVCNPRKSVKEILTADFADFTDKHTVTHPCHPRNPRSKKLRLESQLHSKCTAQNFLLLRKFRKLVVRSTRGSMTGQ
jgi:hypothetical protein